MHTLGKAGWQKPAEYLVFQNAGGDKSFVVLVHGVNRLWTGRDLAFGAFGRLHENHDLHSISPGWGGFLCKDTSSGWVSTTASKKICSLSIVLSVGAKPSVLDRWRRHTSIWRFWALGRRPLRPCCATSAI